MSAAKTPAARQRLVAVNLDEETIGRLMKEVGFETRGGAWKWRGRRPDRGQQPPPPAGHAFAELAKLRR